MKTSKTKRALLLSVCSIALCLVMLVGTTFAWFTDTASTAVNTIQSGTLVVDIVDEEGASLKGGSMSFVNATGSDDILWEPGVTFRTPEFYVTSTGSLALKYKMALNGITGDSELLDVIKFSVVTQDADGTFKPVDLDRLEGHLTPAAPKSEALYIEGHMEEAAGNEYQGKTLKGLGITVLATQDTVEYDSKDNQYDAGAEYPTITTGASLEKVFGDANIDFGYGSTSTEAVVLDGKGLAVVENWTDAWVNSDTTIKGVTFKNGAVFSTKADNVTVTLENCTFYACDQSKLTYNGNNSLTNSGAGMCLNLEKSANTGVKFVVKNCVFVGENDNTLPVDGPRYNGDGTVNGTKKRGHAIAIDAICGGGTGTLDSVLIEGCVINGVRGNAIQLYGKTGDITIRDTKINSWAVNSTGIGYAIRGDFDANGSRTLTLTNVYFGLDEISGNTEFGHVKVGSFSGNTDGTEAAGTYSK